MSLPKLIVGTLVVSILIGVIAMLGVWAFFMLSAPRM